MKITEKNHVTELLFPVALLCVFLITGVLVIIICRPLFLTSQKRSGRMTAAASLWEKLTTAYLPCCSPLNIRIRLILPIFMPVTER